MTMGQREPSNLRPYPEKRIIIIETDKEEYLDYDTGDIKGLDLLSIELLDGNGGFICGRSLYVPLANISKEFEGKGIRWRTSIVNPRRKAYSRNGEMTVLGTFQIAYFSYLIRSSGAAGFATKRWDILNLENFTECSQFTLQETVDASLAILTLCHLRKVNFRNTRGSLSGQFLKASPYWKSERGYKTRRPAPKFINDFSRNYLPGNHYSISSNVTGRAINSALYVDQENSHHSVANSIHIPHPEFIRARGYYKSALRNQQYKKWLDRIPINQAGLFLCRVEIATITNNIKHLYPKWVTERKAGGHFIWIWSPEVRLFEDDHHVNINYVVCGFCTNQHDLAITEYSSWALEELKKPNKKYIKQVLLAAYGMLAFNPTGYKSYRYWAGTLHSRGSLVKIPIVDTAKEVVLKLPSHVQSNITNVLARGIIESETRARSLELARSLHRQKINVPQVYADALVVESDRVPFLNEPWRISHALTNVRIPRPNAIISDQMLKMPGMTREESERRFRSRVPFFIAGAIPMEEINNVRRAAE